MDVRLIGLEHATGQQEMSDGDVEHSEGIELNNTEYPAAQNVDKIVEPYEGMEFDSEKAARLFYDEYARCAGFGTKFGQPQHSGTDLVAHEFECIRGGVKRRLADSCDAMLRIELKGVNKWIVTRFVKEHNHLLVSPGKMNYLKPSTHFAAVKATEDSHPGSGVVPTGVMYVSMGGNHVSMDTNNRGATHAPPAESNRTGKNAGAINFSLRPVTRKRTLGRDAQHLLDYLKNMQAENSGFFYAVQLDDDNRMANVFWADARSRTAYMHFGDAVVVSTSYAIDQYRVPLAQFSGVNHHGQVILFGCALLLDFSEASFIWLFKTFLTAMSDHHPVSLITDQDKTIQTAVRQVFPEVRHCINKWHLFRGGHEKLALVCLAHPNFQVELYNCINMTETIEEFESSWSFILDKYDLRGHDWFQLLYNSRAQWVPAYFRDTFFAAISPNQGLEASFFDGYVNQHTTIPVFFRQYERAMENWFEREIEADHDTICTTPVLKTPSPMEKQAANLYTRKIFNKFQEELVETFVYTANKIDSDGSISTFRVAKFEDDSKAYVVTLNYPEMRANCSCQMFEYSGILCRHVLTVFTVTNVLTLPSHYILKRWTKNAKSAAADEQASNMHGQESLTLRYNNLCRETIKYAEEGATTPETFNLALATLREGGKKVEAVKRNIAKVAPTGSQVSGASFDNRKTSLSASETPPLLWPRQDEMTRRFNLNDAGFPARSVADLNLPCMAPVSLHRDDGYLDHMVEVLIFEFVLCYLALLEYKNDRLMLYFFHWLLL